MRIVKNTSHADTRFLRSLVVLVHNHMAKTEGRLKVWKSLEVKFGSRRDHHVTGYAYVGTGPVHISIGKTAVTRTVIKVIFHELMHVYGYTSHRNGRCDPRPDDISAMMKGQPESLRGRVAAKRVPRDLVKDRYNALVARQEAWERKLKRAQTALGKIKQQRRYYERKYRDRLEVFDVNE